MDGKRWLLLAVSLAACGPGSVAERGDLGDLQVEPVVLDFGDVLLGEQVQRTVTIRNTGDTPLGIAQIAMMDGEFASSFSVDYDFVESVCYGGAPSDRGQVLNADCSVPVHVTMAPDTLGPVAAGVQILTADDPSDHPTYHRDPDELFAVAIATGSVYDERPRVHVEPTALDFGFVWLGETSYRQVRVTNVGSEPLTIGGFEIPADYTDQFSVPDDPTGQAIDPGGSVLVEIAFSPQTVEQVRNEPDTWIRILTDDPSHPASEVRMVADQADTEQDAEPTVTLIGPPPGTIVEGEELVLELTIHDTNQPAPSLSCRVMSAGLLKTALTQCAAPDDTGHFFVSVPTTLLESGVDTIAVEVWDAFGQKTIVSTTIAYGVTLPEGDADGDGYAGSGAGGLDCDDGDARVYPGAAEIADGKDNDCETTCAEAYCGAVTIDTCIDEDTRLGDSDADCYVEDPAAENGGDCNDSDPSTFPGAVDLVDFRDNDCDGEVDEVISHDDLDGDGFSAWSGDCNEADATVGPAAVEYCEGSDENCDGTIDEGCLPADTSPVIVGGLRLERTDIGVGEAVEVTAMGFDPDGDTVSYLWTQDKALTGQALVGSGGEATFRAPDDLPGGAESVTYELMVQVSGDAGPGDWAFGYVTVHENPVETTFGSGDEAGGCGEKGGGTAFFVAPLGALAWGLRRRRSAIETSR
jgi:hypothetical protein